MMLKFRTDSWHLIDDVQDLEYEIGFREWPPDTGPEEAFPELGLLDNEEVAIWMTSENDGKQRNPDGTRIVRAFTFATSRLSDTGRRFTKVVITDAQPVYVLNDQGDTIDRI